MAKALSVYGDYSLAECITFERILREGDTAIDAGASIGVFTLVMARACGPKGKVLAFEPQLPIFELLRQNLELNGIENVQARRCALSSNCHQRYVPNINIARPGNMGAIGTADTQADGLVPVTTISIDDLGLDACDLVKIDTEGHESQVLDGGWRTIEDYRPWISLEMDRLQDSYDWFHRLQELKYDMYFYYPLIIHNGNFKGVPADDVPRIVSSNIICFPRTRRPIDMVVQVYKITSEEQIVETVSRLKVAPL